jgi:hypothetical protein
MVHRRFSGLSLSVLVLFGLSMPLAAQEGPQRTLEFGGVPALNYDSDEGFGYGVIAELYRYEGDERTRYLWTIQPRVFLTTEGRRDVYAFFDAPGLLSNGWRLSAFAGFERHLASPFYGLGNGTVFDETLSAEDGPNPSYYRFGVTRKTLSADIQRSFEGLPLRLLVGGGIVRADLVRVPDGIGTTVFAGESTADEQSWSNFARSGLVWDTRDRETAPTRGSWSEFLVTVVPSALGASSSYVRWTVNDRRYLALTESLVFAHRYLLQNVSSGAPVHDLSVVQSSFRQQEGLGGAKTVRGVLRNRFTGRGMLVWNAELRWRFWNFGLFGRPSHMVLSAFMDQGRVWDDGVVVSELFSDLHRGYGGGVRLGMGENFVVAVDAGTSVDTGLPIYIGLGYLY